MRKAKDIFQDIEVKERNLTILRGVGDLGMPGASGLIFQRQAHRTADAGGSVINK